MAPRIEDRQRTLHRRAHARVAARRDGGQRGNGEARARRSERGEAERGVEANIDQRGGEGGGEARGAIAEPAEQRGDPCPVGLVGGVEPLDELVGDGGSGIRERLFGGGAHPRIAITDGLDQRGTDGRRTELAERARGLGANGGVLVAQQRRDHPRGSPSRRAPGARGSAAR